MLTKLKTYAKYTFIRKWRKEPHKIRIKIIRMEFIASFGNIVPPTGSEPLTIIKVSHTNQSKEIFNSVITYHHWNEMKISHYKNKRMLKY